MEGAYANCYSLNGKPACGPNVMYLCNAYNCCYNLTGVAVFGPNLINVADAYRSCKNLSAGNIYVYSNKIANAYGCFASKNTSRRYNIHVPATGSTLNAFLNSDILGFNITWTNVMSSNRCYYNTQYNVYIYSNTSL
jgi:hypothetical protein